MKILIDIGHPSDVHLFKNFTKEFGCKTDSLLVTVRDIPAAKELLKSYEIPFIDLGNKSDTIKGKIFNQIKYNFKLRKIARENKIDLAIGVSITIAHVSKMNKMKSIVFDDDDDEVQPFMIKFGHPFADLVLSPDVLKNKRRKKETIYYAGYKELAYLHPNRFVPDKGILQDSKLKEGEKYFVLRFNSFKAHHDIGEKGLSIENKRKIIRFLSEYGKVFITTEREIDPEFKKYKISIPYHKIHSFLNYSTMLIGDSQTMTSEAAVLGVPSIRSNSFVGRISYLEEEEHKYGLTFGFRPDQSDKMFEKILELLNNPKLKEEWQVKRKKLLADKIDVTAFMVWFIKNYPDSVNIMKQTPDFQFRFR
jgi:uncharacterized protein